MLRIQSNLVTGLWPYKMPLHGIRKFFNKKEKAREKYNPCYDIIYTKEALGKFRLCMYKMWFSYIIEQGLLKYNAYWNFHNQGEMTTTMLVYIKRRPEMLILYNLLLPTIQMQYQPTQKKVTMNLKMEIPTRMLW